MKKSKKIWGLIVLVAVTLPLSACARVLTVADNTMSPLETTEQNATTNETLPTTFDGTNQEAVIHNNQPTFLERDLSLSKGVWQTFSELDRFNRVGVANALIGKESFPQEAREPLNVKPTGWNQKKLTDGSWLYNRCHLIGFQMTGENNNPKNLMTGTRSFNTPHMLNYENQIMDYIHLTGNHVRYRVTPHFIGDELVARGIQLEAQSVEEQGFRFNAYIHNVEEDYTINYLTGKATKN